MTITISPSSHHEKKNFFSGSRKSSKRAVGLRSISADLDLGNGLTIEVYETETEALGGLVNEYNEILAGLDAKNLMIRDMERKLRDLSDRMLEGVSARFTKK